MSIAELLYEELAPLYALSMRLLPVWRRYVDCALEWLPDQGTVIEIGPGPGHLLAQLGSASRLAVGIDLYEGMLAVCRKRLARAGRLAPLVRGDARYLPVATDTVDGVVLTFALGAIPDPQLVLGEIRRVLKPGGRLVMVEANQPTDRAAGRRLVALWQKMGAHLWDVRDETASAGLDVVVWREFGAFGTIGLIVATKPTCASKGDAQL